MVDIEQLRAEFEKRYGGAPRVFSAPGRVNLIGEHTDYNDGFVLPVAIDFNTAVAIVPRQDRLVRVHSLNVDETLEFDLDAEGRPQKDSWIDYVEGTARMIEERGERLRGADMLIDSDVPDGAGLSSSAALEISTGMAIAAVSEVEIDKVSLALCGQRAEHLYVGTRSGIMDQFISALGEKGHALLIDCRALEPTHIPFDDSEVALVICDTRVKHSLATSEYNTRRAECEQGVELLRARLPGITALRDVTIESFEEFESELPDTIRMRCRHVIEENQRTLDAARMLREGRLEGIGKLMYESHRSLRDDYQVSCAELDALVEIASTLEGVIGARMTGGGFGGCTVNFVRRDMVDQFSEEVSRQYADRFRKEPGVYRTGIADGAGEVERGTEGLRD